MTVRIRCFNVTVPVLRSGPSRRLSLSRLLKWCSSIGKWQIMTTWGRSLSFPWQWGMWNIWGRPESCTCFHSAHHSDVDVIWGIICWFFLNTRFLSGRWGHALFSAWLRVYAELALRRAGYPIKGSDTTGTDTLFPSKADDCQIVNQNIQRSSFPTPTRIQSLALFFFCVLLLPYTRSWYNRSHSVSLSVVEEMVLLLHHFKHQSRWWDFWLETRSFHCLL